MKFKNRTDAGHQLAERLVVFADRDDVVVLGLPRGGVPVAAEVAHALHAPLDVFLSHKLGVPGQEELAFGAVTSGGGCYLDERLIRATSLTPEDVSGEEKRVRDQLEQLERMYRGERIAASLRDRVVIVVDDGIATGSSMIAAIHAIRAQKPAKIVVAAPVAPVEAYAALSHEADIVIVLRTPAQFYAVGQFYDDFRQTTNEEVVALLRHSAQRSEGYEKEIIIPFSNLSLSGVLTVVPSSDIIVVFVHGSGSSRRSPRNQYVADRFKRNGMATLLFDLLTTQEEAEDQRTGAIRFNIDLLTNRLLHVVEWLHDRRETSRLSVVLFGASTGAAAALRAAAHLQDAVSAVVSRGGRPDLAGGDLKRVVCPTLLIVGGNDHIVLELNRHAMDAMRCVKELAIVPNAGHLFEEPHALEKVADLALTWIIDKCHAVAEKKDLHTVA